LKKQFVIATVAKILQKILTFCQGVIVARVLLAEGNGTIAAFTAVYALVVNATTFGVPNSSAYYLTKKDWDIKTISMLHSFVFVFGGIISSLVLVIALYYQNLSNNYTIVLVLVLQIFINRFISNTSSIALANKWIENLVLREFVANLLGFGFIVLFIYFLKKNVEWFFISIALSEFLSLFVVFFWLKKVDGYGFKFNFNAISEFISPFFKKGIMYALPLFIFGINYQADIIILKHFVVNSEIGIYSIAVSLSVLLWFLPDVYMRIVLSHSFASKISDERTFSKKIWKNTLKIMAISLIVIIFIYFFAPFIIPLIYGKEFAASIYPFKVLLIGTFAMIGFHMLNGDLIGRGRPGIALIIFSIAAIINIAGNIIFIPYFGIVASAWTSSLTYLLGSVSFMYVYYKKFIKENKKESV